MLKRKKKFFQDFTPFSNLKKILYYTLKVVWIQNKYYKQDKKTLFNIVE